MGKYADQARAAINARKADLKYIGGHAIQDVVEHAQTSQPSVKQTGGSFVEGKIPVDSADLIKSLETKINGSVVAKGPTSFTVAIDGFEIGDILQFEWTQEYARRIEFGFTGEDKLGRKYNVPGRHFVGANVARFEEFVEKRAAKVRAQ